MTLFAAAGEFGLHKVSLPHNRRQVPSAVIGEGGDVGALRFGYEMGTGMRTFMPSNLPYVALLATALIAGWFEAVLLGLGFGLGRTWMALGRHYSGDADRWDDQWQTQAGTLLRVLAILALLFAGAFIARL
jgi:hypothetical protein